MKKLIQKDRKLRDTLVKNDSHIAVLKLIIKNFNFFTLIRWKAFLKLQSLTENVSNESIVNRCLLSVNRKRFNKLTGFSRQVFLKIIRAGEIPGIKKSSW